MASNRSTDGLPRALLIIAGLVVLFPLLMMAFAMPMMGAMRWWNGGAGGLSPLWALGMMLLWVVVLVGPGYLLYRGLVGGLGTASATDPAIEDLRLAYAAES